MNKLRVVEMMNHKNFFITGLIVTILIGIIASPMIHAIHACEEYEKKTTYCKEEEPKAETQPKNFFDVLVERYPVLDQIIQMLLNLILKWLSSSSIANLV